MSTGNENFITIDNIAEIQDIVNGDYIFTINNGVIYKLDFENFIISKENTTFSTLIDSMSAAVVSNTKSLCAINGYINKIKPSLNNIDSVVSTVSALSADWDSTYTTINTLSSQAFLPIGTKNNPIDAGSMIYYDGDSDNFTTIPPGFTGAGLTINSGGLPEWMASGTGRMESRNGTETIYNNTEDFRASSKGQLRVDETKTIAIGVATTNYKKVQINYSVLIMGSGANWKHVSSSWKSDVTVIVNGVNKPATNGVAVIQNVLQDQAIQLRVNVTGSLASFTGANVFCHWKVIFEEEEDGSLNANDS